MGTNYYKPHDRNRDMGDPRLGGPYLDDIRAAQEDARREARKKRGENKKVNQELLADKKIQKINKRGPKEYDDKKQRPVANPLVESKKEDG